MKSLRRTPPIKRAPRMRSVGRMRIDAAAELLRLEYEKARLGALRGHLAGGLGRADTDLATAEKRVAWVLDLLANGPKPSSAPSRSRKAPISAEQRISKVLELLGVNAETTR